MFNMTSVCILSLRGSDDYSCPAPSQWPENTQDLAVATTVMSRCGLALSGGHNAQKLVGLQAGTAHQGTVDVLLANSSAALLALTLPPY